MTTANALENRHMIPRWRDSFVTALLGEFDPYVMGGPSKIIPDSTREYLKRKLDEWQSNQSVSFASDAVAVGLTSGLFGEVSQPAQFLLKKSTDASGPAVRLATRALELQDYSAQSRTSYVHLPTVSPRHEIHRLRNRLRMDPRNVVALVDMARYYAVLGQSRKAVNTTETALKLDSNSRFVTRSAARLFLTIRDRNRAYDVIRRNLSIDRDPWLMSAEIAIAQLMDKAPGTVRRARRLLDADEHSPFQLSELAGSLATLELAAGRDRIARRLFRRSLADPTENAVAQANWASTQLEIVVQPSLYDLPHAYEARSVMNYVEGNWENALAAIASWREDEPFSTRPLTLGSFILGAIRQDHDSAIKMLEPGLMVQPHHPNLLNNLVYSLAQSGQIDRAVEESKHLTVDPSDSVTRVSVPATLGMLKYLQGDPEEGFKLYEVAKAAASGGPRRRSRAYATAFHAIEEAKFGTERAERLIRETESAAREFPEFALTILLRRAKKTFKARHFGSTQAS